MRILAADTSTAVNTVAVCEGERLLAETVVDCGRAHSERLLATVDWVLAEAGVKIEELDALAISAGPGSFTGLRVGVATWKGLAAGAKLPLVPVPTLDALARVGAVYEGLVCALLDAKMGDVFGALYRFAQGRRTKLAGDRVGVVEDLIGGIEDDIRFLGDGAMRYRERIEAAVASAIFVEQARGVPRASAVALEAHMLLDQGACTTDPAEVAPVYLRKSQAEVNRDKAQHAAQGSPADDSKVASQ